MFMQNLTAKLHHNVDQLVKIEPSFGQIVTQHGYPPYFGRPQGFQTLLHIILEQQVSLASARAALNKLLAAVDQQLTPKNFLTFDDAELKGFGFSRQKTRNGRILAQAIINGELDLEGLPSLDDEAVRSELTHLTGIGPWTADVYLMMALGRPDIWPAADLALQAAAREIFDLPSRPKSAEMIPLAEPWRPYRTAAAHLLWHYYLSPKS